MENTTNLTPEEVVEKLDGIFSEKSASFSTKEDLEAHKTELMSEIDSLKSMEEKSVEVEKAIAKLEGRMDSFNEKAHVIEAKPLSPAKAIFKSYSDNLNDIKSTIDNGGRKRIDVDVKAVTTESNWAGTDFLTELDRDIDQLSRKRKGILDIVNVGTVSTRYITYVSHIKGTKPQWVGDGEVSEGVLKEEGAEDWRETTEEVKKIAGWVKVSKEMLDDLGFIRSEINNDLLLGMREQIEDSLLNGLGGSQINGLLSLGMGLPPFIPGPFANAIAGANISDVIRVAVAQVESENYTPTHIVMHPQDVASMQLTKGTDNTYTYPMYLPGSEEASLRVAGITVVSSTYIAQDTFLLGDFSKVNVRMRNNIELEVGLDSDDFTKNLVTMLVEARLVQYVKGNDKKAFVQGSISNAITGLTPTP